VWALRQEKRMSKLIMFHARECPHCKAMIPLVDKLEEEEEISRPSDF
jgi:thiol-disulfide isomerase/thioredoxin